MKVSLYPALTGSKTSISRYRERRKIDDGGSTAHKSPIGLTIHQWEETRTDESFTLSRFNGQ